MSKTNLKLVGKTLDGSFYVKSKAFDSEHSAIQRALELLYDYEQTGLSPYEIQTLVMEHEKDLRVIRQLAEGELKNMERLSEEIKRASQKEG